MKDFFDGKKVLIVVPHQDDEINVASGVLSLDIDKSNIYVVYTTNGDFSINADIRYKEAIKALKCFGIKKKNVIFLGYSDQSYSQNTHMYNNNNDWVSNNNITRTYGALKIDEYCYSKNKEHKLFNRKNLYDDIVSVLEEIMPDIIIGIDLDFHPDHIMTSLLLEKAIGYLLQNNLEYHPIVLKTFAYENAYFGANDFNDLNQYGMKFIKKDYHLKSNPYYSDDNCLSFSVSDNAKCLNLRKNVVFKAIKKHVSQLLIMHSFQIISPNNVYWYRFTDNLINKAYISVSSGNKTFLNDFMLSDIDNVLHGDKKELFYDCGIWIPEKKDNNKLIKIKFEKEEYIKYINLYSGRLHDKKKINKIRVTLDNDSYDYELNDYFIDVIKVDKFVSEICIKILDDVVENGFSEIELLNDAKMPFKTFKVIINNTWSNNLICLNKEVTKYNMELLSNYSSSFSLNCNNLNNGYVKENKIFLSKKTTGYIEFYDCYGNYKERIYVNKNVLLTKIAVIMNGIYIKFAIVFSKTKRKIIFLKYKCH